MTNTPTLTSALTSTPPCPEADLWILAGQSNMQGCGFLHDIPAAHPRIWSFGMDYQWTAAVPPLHDVYCATDPVHRRLMLEVGVDGPALAERARLGRAGTDRMCGPGFYFARTLLEHLPASKSIALLPCAHGGSSLDQWSPDHHTAKGSGDPGDTLYGAMLKRLAACGLRPKGVLWYQGESDAAPGLAASYCDRFIAFVDRLRADLGAPDLPVLTVQIGRVTLWGTPPADWELIREMQRQAISRRPNIFMTTGIDGALNDGIHLDIEAQETLGERLGRLALTHVYQSGDFGGQIDLARVEVGRFNPPSIGLFPRQRVPQIRLYFSGVRGQLKSVGRPTGFNIQADPPGVPPLDAYRIDLNVDGPGSVVLSLNDRPSRCQVGIAYGTGFSPYCNITDETNMPLPAFGWTWGELAE